MDLRFIATLVFALGLLGVDVAQGIAQARRPNHDPTLPIEITADSLEVKQNESLAVFRGNVDAIQGTIRLRANEILVRYGSDQVGTSNISRLDATGHVRFSTAEETANGDTGFYDVAQQFVVLTGTVILTRGENVVRGERLTLNLATGESKVEGSTTRVKGLFQPPKKSS